MTRAASVRDELVVRFEPGIQTPDPSRRPPGKPPPPLPPGGIIPDETPPPGDDVPFDEGEEIRDPGRRMPPDHLPGGPSNPNPHHAARGRVA